jgi:hypothetical protein
LRKGLRLYSIDPTDPLAFEAVYEKQPFRVVFERAAVFATAAWQGYETFVRPSGGTGGDGDA